MENHKDDLKNNRIIVIDGDPGIRETYLSILSEPRNREVLSKGAELFDGDLAPFQYSQEQFDVTLADRGDTGIAAVERAVEKSRKFAVAFIDMNIPGMNGAQTAKRIWEIDEDMKIIFVTAFSEHSPDDINRITGRDDSFYLRKPFNPEEIKQFARALTNEWALEREREQLSEELEHMNQNLNEQVEQQTAMLIQTEKMASIGILATGVAHEIRAPLSQINHDLSQIKTTTRQLADLLDGYELLAKEVERNDRKKYQKTIEKLSTLKQQFESDIILESISKTIDYGLADTDKILKIITDLKSFSKEDEAEYRLVDIHDLIEATLYVIYDDSKYDIEIEKSFDETLPQIRCFPQKLSQVFINLLVNSAQAIDGKGLISIKTEQVKALRRMGEPKIRITLTDNGCGIPAEKLNQVFDPFYTTKSVKTGTGLGLSITYDIIKAHGGRITVKSRPEEGTSFAITLPQDINM